MTAGAVRHAVPPSVAGDVLAGFDPSAAVVDLAGETMGTGWRVRLAAPPGFAVDAIRAAIEARLAGLVAEMSHWDESSLLCAFNRAPAGHWTTLPTDFAAVIDAALTISEQSQGAFDATTGALADLWGLGPHPAPTPLDDAAIAAARAQSGWRRLAFDRAGRRIRQPGGLWLDLSGIAKGHAADCLALLLDRRGVRHCLVEVGGECVGRGMRPDMDPWWVELETPPGTALPPLRVALHGIAVATSGNHVRGEHTLDPRTGRPAAGNAATVSVLHRAAMLADGWATALLAMDFSTACRAATDRGLAIRMIARHGGEWLSPAMMAML